MIPQVKICGLMRHADAAVAVEAGAAFLGVILATGGARTVSLEQAAAVLGDLPAQRVGVFVNAELNHVLRTATALRLDVIQLHGKEAIEDARMLRGAGPWRVWKAVRVQHADDYLRAAAEFAGAVDGLLLDGWHPHSAGGTGTQFPWEEVARHRATPSQSLSLIAAGGLRPDNVAQAVQLLRPSVVDVSSGVEHAPGIKDPDAVHAFVAAATQMNHS